MLCGAWLGWGGHECYVMHGWVEVVKDAVWCMAGLEVVKDALVMHGWAGGGQECYVMHDWVGQGWLHG